MGAEAKKQGERCQCSLDAQQLSWYSSLENLKFLRNEKVGFLFGIANNRQVSIEKGKELPVKDLEIPEAGLVVYLKSFGWVKVFCQQFKNEPRYYIVYHQDLDVLNQIKRDEFKSLHDSHWQIEEFHRVIKQVCNIPHSVHKRRTKKIRKAPMTKDNTGK